MIFLIPTYAQWEQVNGFYCGMFSSLAVSSNGAGGTNIFAGTSYGGVFLSTDNGRNGTPVNSGLTYNAIPGWRNNDIRAFAVSGKDLFAGTFGGGVFLSAD